MARETLICGHDADPEYRSECQAAPALALCPLVITMHLPEDIPMYCDPAAGIDGVAGTEDHVIQRTEAMPAYPAGRTAKTGTWRRQQPVIVFESHQGNIDRQRPSL